MNALYTYVDILNNKNLKIFLQHSFSFIFPCPFYSLQRLFKRLSSPLKTLAKYNFLLTNLMALNVGLPNCLMYFD